MKPKTSSSQDQIIFSLKKMECHVPEFSMRSRKVFQIIQFFQNNKNQKHLPCENLRDADIAIKLPHTGEVFSISDRSNVQAPKSVGVFSSNVRAFSLTESTTKKNDLGYYRKRLYEMQNAYIQSQTFFKKGKRA